MMLMKALTVFYSTSRHHHHSHPWGPHFEENPVNVTVREGENTRLDCRVGLIEDKLVMPYISLIFCVYTTAFHSHKDVRILAQCIARAHYNPLG